MSYQEMAKMQLRYRESDNQNNLQHVIQLSMGLVFMKKKLFDPTKFILLGNFPPKKVDKIKTLQNINHAPQLAIQDMTFDYYLFQDLSITP